MPLAGCYLWNYILQLVYIVNQAETKTVMNYIIPFIIIIGLSLAIIIWRGSHIKRLTHRGVAGTGKVIKKFRQQRGGSSSSECLRYEYNSPTGERFENKIHVPQVIYDQHEEGDSIDIVYLPDTPKISAGRYLINQTRAALKLPPL